LNPAACVNLTLQLVSLKDQLAVAALQFKDPIQTQDFRVCALLILYLNSNLDAHNGREQQQQQLPHRLDHKGHGRGRAGEAQADRGRLRIGRQRDQGPGE